MQFVEAAAGHVVQCLGRMPVQLPHWGGQAFRQSQPTSKLCLHCRLHTHPCAHRSAACPDAAGYLSTAAGTSGVHRAALLCKADTEDHSPFKPTIYAVQRCQHTPRPLHPPGCCLHRCSGLRLCSSWDWRLCRGACRYSRRFDCRQTSRAEVSRQACALTGTVCASVVATCALPATLTVLFGLSTAEGRHRRPQQLWLSSGASLTWCSQACRLQSCCYCHHSLLARVQQPCCAPSYNCRQHLEALERPPAPSLALSCEDAPSRIFCKLAGPVQDSPGGLEGPLHELQKSSKADCVPGANTTSSDDADLLAQLAAVLVWQMSLILVMQPAAPEVAFQGSTSMTRCAVGQHITLGRRIAVCTVHQASDRQHATMSMYKVTPKTCWWPIGGTGHAWQHSLSLCSRSAPMLSDIVSAILPPPSTRQLY